MGTIGEDLRRRRDPITRTGQGLQVSKLPDPIYQQFQDFSGGFSVEHAPESTRVNSSPAALDMLVDYRNRLARMPGVAVLENLTHTPQALFVHPNLDNAADEVLVSSPFVGFRQAGVTNWTNANLPGGGEWTSTLHAGNLLFSNNVGDVYVRPLGTNAVTPLGWGEAGALQSFGGRVFAGAANIGGTRNPLGIKWTGASGDYTDFAGPGSGYELLLSDTSENDRIVSMKAIGFQQLVILLRKGIWVGPFTGDANRPADFQPRVVGVGAVNSRCVASVKGGVLFLSDRGVHFFDGNTATHISAAIDSEILPIDFGNIKKYHAVYNSVKQTYTLFTSSGTYVFDLVNTRWLKSSLRADMSAAIYNPLTIDYALTAGWGLSWSGYWGTPPAAGTTSLFDDELYVQGSTLGRPDINTTSYFGVAQQVQWTTAEADITRGTDVVRYQMFDFDYDGGGTLDVQVPNGMGDYISIKNLVLPTSSVRRSIRTNVNRIGLGFGVRLAVLSGNPRIWKFGALMRPEGRRAS